MTDNSNIDRVNKFAADLNKVEVRTQFLPVDEECEDITEGRVLVSLVQFTSYVVEAKGDSAEEACGFIMEKLTESLAP